VNSDNNFKRKEIKNYYSPGNNKYTYIASQVSNAFVTRTQKLY